MDIQNKVDEMVKRITSVEWRSEGTKSEARRLLHALLAEIEKEISGWKERGDGPRVTSWNLAIEQVKKLLRPSKPKGEEKSL